MAVPVGDDGAWEAAIALEAPGDYLLDLQTANANGVTIGFPIYRPSPWPKTRPRTPRRLRSGEMPQRGGDRGGGTTATTACGQLNGFVRDDVYVVGPCDNMFIIARELQIDFFAFVALNPEVGDINLIFPGQTLRLPPR